LNAGIEPLPFAIACRTVSSELPDRSRRIPYKDGPTLVSPERTLWHTKHDFRKMMVPRSLDAGVEESEELLAKDGARVKTKQAMT
jgi:hypothetical protein